MARRMVSALMGRAFALLYARCRASAKLMPALRKIIHALRMMADKSYFFMVLAPLQQWADCAIMSLPLIGFCVSRVLWSVQRDAFFLP